MIGDVNRMGLLKCRVLNGEPVFKMDESNNWFINKGLPEFVWNDPIEEQKIHSSDKALQCCVPLLLAKLLLTKPPDLYPSTIFFRPKGMCMLAESDIKEITNALEGAGRKRVEAEGSQMVAMMTNMYVLANGVTYVELVPHLYWKTKVYDMVSGKSRCVPNVMLRSFIHAS
ncbi:hypothetical protein MTR_1g060820 [Medicago truncatula]|uniref:Uncharacterized protein n=1 Tax=Medicago truncatula TaxID=3880 RepID=A0A072VKW8_MEDTR|nr:hypothetical protein MTR_1g060820 [Medicago truncatula]